MEVIKRSPNFYILRLDPDEELVKEIQDFCGENFINTGWINVLGSAKSVDLAFFDTELKDYDIRNFEEFLEIVSIEGNIALKDDKPFLHAHGVFGRGDMSTIGGHIHRCVVSATAEAAIFVEDGKTRREFDKTSGLYLLEP
jgi:predicted DNA-binding protein with PD1-like motif